MRVIHILACEAFQLELDKVLEQIYQDRRFYANFSLSYLDQRLHTDLSALKLELSTAISNSKADKILLLYGCKCHPDLQIFTAKDPVVFLDQINCIHAITGIDTSAMPRTFFLTPRELCNWRRFFAYEAKTDHEKAVFREKFGLYCDEALFCDTGVRATTKEQLEDFALCSGLKTRSENIGIEIFKTHLITAIEKALK